MHAITSARTIKMGGKFACWDALDANSAESGKSEKLLINLGHYCFHAHVQHRGVLRGFIAALFETTTNSKINAVKLEALA